MFNELKIPTMIKIAEIAEMYGLPTHFVRELVNNGEVVATRVGNKILVNAERFGEYLNNNTIANHSDNEKSTARREVNRTEHKPRISPINRRK